MAVNIEFDRNSQFVLLAMHHMRVGVKFIDKLYTIFINIHYEPHTRCR